MGENISHIGLATSYNRSCNIFFIPAYKNPIVAHDGHLTHIRLGGILSVPFLKVMSVHGTSCIIEFLEKICYSIIICILIFMEISFT